MLRKLDPNPPHVGIVRPHLSPPYIVGFRMSMENPVLRDNWWCGDPKIDYTPLEDFVYIFLTTIPTLTEGGSSYFPGAL